MSDYLLLAVGILLTIGTGLFVASEFSLINVERSWASPSPPSSLDLLRSRR